MYLHQHVSAETASGQRNALRRQLLAKSLEQRFRDLRRRGISKTWAAAPAGVTVQRELRDDQRATPVSSRDRFIAP